ncbi:MAG: aldo/keto reductase [Asticcacaulis sp.]
MPVSTLPKSALPQNPLGQTSVQVTTLGFGAATLGNLYRTVTDEVAQASLSAALDAGVRYVDTAPHYGQGLSERRVGTGLKGLDITLSTKVGRVLKPIPAPPKGTERHGFIDGDPYEPHFDYSYDGIMQSFEDSLKRLQRDRVDILLVHDLGEVTHGADAAHHMKTFLDSGYRALSLLKSDGRVGAIGLGVNEWQVCETVMQAVDMDAFLLAGRYTLLEQTALEGFLPDCQRKKISIILGGPFNSGILAEGVSGNVTPHYNYEPAPPHIIRQVAAIEAVCAAHKVPLAAAALQFPLAHPAVACVIPGMANAAQVAANLDLLATPIPAQLWYDLKSEDLLSADAPVPAQAA